MNHPTLKSSTAELDVLIEQVDKILSTPIAHASQSHVKQLPVQVEQLAPIWQLIDVLLLDVSSSQSISVARASNRHRNDRFRSLSNELATLEQTLTFSV